MARTTPLTNNRPIVDGNGIMTQEAREYFNNTSSIPVIVGSGSPEGVIEANQGALYIDSSGAVGSKLYLKGLKDIGGDFSLGWELS